MRSNSSRYVTGVAKECAGRIVLVEFLLCRVDDDDDDDDDDDGEESNWGVLSCPIVVVGNGSCLLSDALIHKQVRVLQV